ncbi:MAG: hypothetical protein KDA24_25575 [Deltaproteobacteria bacterium]|nr:hypothetical protein [Deltaproteobacteria bacterium]
MTAPPALGPGRVTSLVASFLELHPELRIELTLTDRMVNPILDGVDIAIRNGASIRRSTHLVPGAPARGRLSVSARRRGARGGRRRDLRHPRQRRACGRPPGAGAA